MLDNGLTLQLCRVVSEAWEELLAETKDEESLLIAVAHNGKLLCPRSITDIKNAAPCFVLKIR